jgi:hypothetical protein
MNGEVVSKPALCSPPPPLRTAQRRFTGVLALVMTVLGLWMLWDLTLRQKTKYPCEHAFHHGIDSPVLAVELASNAHELRTALEPACRAELSLVSSECQAATLSKLQLQARSAIRRDTVADCFFIPLYALFVWAFGVLFARPENSRIPILLGVLMIATAAADYAENFGMFRALRMGSSDWIAQQICWPSRCKWALLGIALLVTAWILCRSDNPIYTVATRRLFAIGYIVSGALILVGLLHPGVIGVAMTLFSLIVLLQIIALLGPFVSGWIPPTVPKYEEDFCERKKQEKVDLAVHS